MYVGLKRGNISQGMYLGELKMFGEKKPGKMYIIFWYWSYTQTLKLFPEVVLLFHFHQTPLIFLVKIILIQI